MKRITSLILLVIVIILSIILIATKGLELCGIVGGLWCYPPLSTVANVLSIVIAFIIVIGIGYLILSLIKMKGGLGK